VSGVPTPASELLPAREQPGMKDVRRRVKHVLAWGIFRLGLHRFLLRDRATIVVFHRIDDGLREDPISCGTREFEGFCRFFARFFEVISLEELLRRLEARLPLGGTLCITFDDGYLDNRTRAAPMLREHGLPACFFISSGLVGSTRIPSWDAEQGIDSKWMSWSDVHALVKMGFGVGAHTVSHPDLGALGRDDARREIAESRARLEAELGIPVPWFSFPFGGRAQATPDKRAIVAELGFQACLSAYGGAVRADSDPLDLPRLPISPWYASTYHLGWEILFVNR
jgi:peptidoglycan/xylan/chitin deacetylase (PgdA/CDA1 family)